MPEELYDEFQALYAHQPHDQPLYEAAVVRFESTKETFQPTFKAQLGSFKNKLAILAAATQNEV
jgi:hypothetical protein